MPSSSTNEDDAVTDLDVVARRGLEHEAAYLDSLRAQGLDVETIELGEGAGDEALVVAEEQTVDAMQRGVDVVFQATFFNTTGDGPAWRGHADFLRNVGTQHAPSYEPEDTKLARHVKPSAVLQLSLYAGEVTRLQGTEPEHIHVVLGGQQRVTFTTRDVAAYYRHAKAKFLDAVASSPHDTYPTPVGHCAICKYADDCTARRAADDHLSLVAGVTSEQIRKFNKVGVTTMAALGAADDTLSVKRIGDATLTRLRRQARLQVEHRATPDAPPPVELLAPTGQDFGFEALPEPSPGDVFFDIEGDPYVGENGIEYLFGVGWWDGESRDETSFQFKAFWGHDDAGEKQLFEDFMDFIARRQAEWPDMHVYHYAPYEPTALGKLMGRYATREQQVDDLLRTGALVDLYRVVRQGVAVGTPSYSIKKLEPLYMAARDAAIKDAGSSIVEYERWLQENDLQILDDIEQYNRDDCYSTALLRDWLEARRVECAAQFGIELARASVGEPLVLKEDAAAEDDGVAQLAARLLDGVDDGTRPDPGESPTDHARWLLAHLLGWHQREAKPEWWAYFNRVLHSTDEDLLADSEAIAGLTYEGVVGTVARSTIHRYAFDPEQEYKLGVGAVVDDPVTARIGLQGGDAPNGPGTIVALDATTGTVDLKRGNNSNAPHPTAIVPQGALADKILRRAIVRLATTVADHGIDADTTSGRAIGDLLARRAPRVNNVATGAPLYADGDDLVDASIDIALRLDHSYLPIQGPPGAGKTYMAARLIVQLVKAGKKVGITANSHAVIGQLLQKVMNEADEMNEKVRAGQRADDDKALDDDRVVSYGDTKAAEKAVLDGELDVIGGTAWLFAREGLTDQLDYLVIDEAGQLSLANVVAVSGAAKNLILVGDQQQLSQPSKGTHPPGVGVSGLDHVLGADRTIPPERGVFLDNTRRLHPNICAFISELAYDMRLHADASCAQQQIADGPVVAGGAGLRYIEVDHEGNRTSSPEEAEAVAAAYNALIGREWKNQRGEVGVIDAEQILVVAPYNAQVRTIAEMLPDGARVGTVDKFQGQEAAAVIVSMTASSAEDIPRGMEFLFSRNRLNVAVSRARALSVLVASPRLLDAQCRKVDQMKLVNGLCRFVEMADVLRSVTKDGWAWSSDGLNARPNAFPTRGTS